MFILRNSRNGYFTKFSTITTKFNITESETWNLVGMLLSSGNLESIHDPMSGEMKIFEVGKKYEILSTGRKRRIEEKEEGRGSRQGEDGRRGGHPRGGKRTQDGGSEESTRKGGRRPSVQKENRGKAEGRQHGTHGSTNGARRPQSN